MCQRTNRPSRGAGGGLFTDWFSLVLTWCGHPTFPWVRGTRGCTGRSQAPAQAPGPRGVGEAWPGTQCLSLGLDPHGSFVPVPPRSSVTALMGAAVSHECCRVGEEGLSAHTTSQHKHWEGYTGCQPLHSASGEQQGMVGGAPGLCTLQRMWGGHSDAQSTMLPASSPRVTL